jgi:PleD family two-component response regulator
MIARQNVEVLVVEDSALQADILRRKLADEGYQVAVAENGAKAMERSAKRAPSIIISDIVMPIMDGYNMCHEIKHDEELKGAGVTISLGVASFEAGIKDKEDLINRADKALYQAKEGGRNQVRAPDQTNGNHIIRQHQAAD